MKTLTLYLKITTFLLLIWMYQCFYNCYSYKTLIDKNILQIKNELKYERVLTEGDIAGNKQTNAEECLEECPLDNEKNKCIDPDLYKNPHHYWRKVMIPKLWERFNKETSEMDPKSKNRKWNVHWYNISTTKVRELYSMSRRRDIPDEEKNEKIDSIMKEIDSEFDKFLYECKKEMTDNKTEYESNKDIIENITESESKKEQGKNEIKNNKLKIWKLFINCFYNPDENKN
ncbi:fam-g protein [Plasmodium gallinaceum]|uniref:Fam-g protein n=1 Tax=Plasmodium gallinaceum TaxID=5849 RepID=A0A1J1GX88_PLAGA|nr:fam-g protein [Plasmodium gallinaceum]CRG96918.1 fam-g protein [Plasmodium gallinaceum]